MMNRDPFLRHLGLARRAGCLAIGQDEVREALARRTVVNVYLASDAARHTIRRVSAQMDQTAMMTLPYDRERLGAALGVTTCTVVAVIDDGMAQGLARAWAERQTTATRPEDKADA